MVHFLCRIVCRQYLPQPVVPDKARSAADPGPRLHWCWQRDWPPALGPGHRVGIATTRSFSKPTFFRIQRREAALSQRQERRWPTR